MHHPFFCALFLDPLRIQNTHSSSIPHLLYTPRHAQKIIDPTLHILVLAADVCFMVADDRRRATHQRIHQSPAQRSDYARRTRHRHQPLRHHRKSNYQPAGNLYRARERPRLVPAHAPIYHPLDDWFNHHFGANRLHPFI